MSLDVCRVRGQFPILSRRINGRPLVYLDNAATSLTPEPVIEAEASFYRTIGGNVHRGRHALSEEASDAFEGARAAIAAFIGARPTELVYTANTTTALNLVSAGLDLPSDSEVVAIASEHHSTLLPWRKRWVVRSLEASPLRAVDPDSFRRAIGPRTRIVVMGHASNVTGLVQPVTELCRIAREYGLVSIVDAAQSAPHLPIDVRSMGCDFLAFSAHKMLGPTGIGALYGRRGVLERLAARDLGGGVIDRVSAHDFSLRPPPACFEAGTPNIAGALGFAAAVLFLQKLGWDHVRAHGQMLRDALLARVGDVSQLRLLTADGQGLPIMSLSAPDAAVRVDDLAMALSDRYGIMTRAGFLCARPFFDALGWSGGALRASAYVYNTVEEMHALGDALAELLWHFSPQ